MIIKIVLENLKKLTLYSRQYQTSLKFLMSSFQNVLKIIGIIFEEFNFFKQLSNAINWNLFTLVLHCLQIAEKIL